MADWSCMADASAVWAIFHSNQWSTTGPSKDVVCAVLSVGKVYIKEPLLLIRRAAYVATIGFLYRNMSQWTYAWCPIADEIETDHLYQSLNETNFPFLIPFQCSSSWYTSHRLQEDLDGGNNEPGCAAGKMTTSMAWSEQPSPPRGQPSSNT